MDSSSTSFSYYVNNLIGTDNNLGTSDRPLKTISAALLKAQPGERIGISSGTYRETLQFPRSGTDPSRTIALEALPGANVQIKSSDLVTGWGLHSGAIWKRTDWDVNSQQVFVDGAPLQQIGVSNPFHSQIVNGNTVLPAIGLGLADMFPGSFWYDGPQRTLFVWLRDGSTPDQHVVEASVRNWVIPYKENLDFIELRGLHFSHSNQTAVGVTNGIVNVSGHSWIISGNAFTYGDFAGLHVFGEGHVIANNICNSNGNSGITINGSDAAHNYNPYKGRPPQDILFDGNETSFNNYRRFDKDWHAGGVKAVSSCNAVRISRHKANSNFGHGIWIDGMAANITIDQCSVSLNIGAGILFEISDGANISNNQVGRNNQQGIYISASSGAIITNNTVDNNWAGIVLHGMPRAEHPYLQNNEVLYNRFRDNAHVDLVIYHNPPSAAGNISDYNQYSRANGSVAISWTNTAAYDINYTVLASFTTATGMDSHSTLIPP